MKKLEPYDTPIRKYSTKRLGGGNHGFFPPVSNLVGKTHDVRRKTRGNLKKWRPHSGCVITLTVTFFLPGQQTSHHEFEVKFFVQELETIDTWKQFSPLVSHSEFNDAEKRYLIFDSTQPFFPIAGYWKFLNFAFHIYPPI